MKRITVFGGGTAHGLWDSKGGWSQRLRNYLYKRTIDTNGEEHWEVYNLAIRGDSSQDIRKRFQRDLKETMKHNEDAEQITVFHVGGNDAQFIYEEDDVRTSPEDFRANLEHIVEQSSDHSDTTVLMGMIPVEEDPKPIPDSGGRSFTSNRMKHYNKIIKEVAEENEDVVLLDLFNQFKGNDEMYQDGLHPNNEGHRIIFEEMKEMLQQNDVI
jgi:lysophospholipase L1-like esterase